ncbi:unnamed protein product [Mytilus coruscus]|uniref:Integrase catalytic domain-containing protein n=1 Tax=Mytilus coruscus TaxID=42192 RepID=A0A6J8F2A8_MYTCO|nr:unnamed protein product [Mytilus coruscus]
MCSIVIDAHSKWPEVIPMKSTTSTQTIRVLRTIFARAGLPEQIVSDNGPQFVSAEFQTFIKMNGITHIKSASYHPATNGLAERFVQTFKQSLKAMRGENSDINKKLAKFLLAYRNTPHTTTNETPSKLFMGRHLRNRLDLIKPDINRQVQDKQMKIAIKPTKETLRKNGQVDLNSKTDKNLVLGKWKSDFEQLFSVNPNVRPPAYDNETRENQPDVTELNEPISREEIIVAVERAKLRKATGFDEIPAEVLKNPTAIDLLHLICNGCFELGKVPDQWTKGIINPIFKCGSDTRNNPLNYRGITLICSE